MAHAALCRACAAHHGYCNSAAPLFLAGVQRWYAASCACCSCLRPQAPMLYTAVMCLEKPHCAPPCPGFIAVLQLHWALPARAAAREGHTEAGQWDDHRALARH